MFKYVHHVNYVVRDIDAMLAYMEKNFGLKPDHRESSKKQHEAYYNIGETQLQILQPLDPDSDASKFLASHGPGVYHVAWGVDDIRTLTHDLAAKGNKFRGKDKIPDNHQSHRGYFSASVDPVSSLGIWFQLIEEHK
jgi:catechol 2,3-dioxygenase-like lactoylglutathione lyase family enzyme